MPDRICETCTHSRDLFMAGWRPPRQDLRCFRPRTMRGGHVEHHMNVGASCAFETDVLDEPHRVAGDKCSPARIHWEAAKDV